MSGRRGSTGWVLRYGVDDLEAERDRLRQLGIEFRAVDTVPDVISYFDFRDPDGNELSCYTVHAT